LQYSVFLKFPAAVLAFCVLFSAPSQLQAQSAQDFIDENLRAQQEHVVDTPPKPLPLSALQTIEPKADEIEDIGMPLDIRRDALKEAAISFGARGGLAWRSFHIRQELKNRASYLDKIYNFRELLIAAPSGLLIEPPIVSESLNAMLIDKGGREAAVSDRIYSIINNARIVSAPRSWRTYLEREWGVVEPPPDILLPINDEEREIWIDLVEEGWEYGVEQANQIFQDDLSRLMADFQGMIRYRLLLAQGMISEPYALQVDRGVTGGGNEMRIGDRAVQITGLPELVPGSERWKPANR